MRRIFARGLSLLICLVFILCGAVSASAVDYSNTYVISQGGTYYFDMNSTAVNAISIETEEPVVINNSDIVGFYAIVTNVSAYDLTVKNSTVTADIAVRNNVKGVGGRLVIDGCRFYSGAEKPREVMLNGSAAISVKAAGDITVKNTTIEGYFYAYQEFKDNSVSAEHTVEFDNVTAYSYFGISTTAPKGSFSLKDCELNIVDRSSVNYAFVLNADEEALTVSDTAVNFVNSNTSFKKKGSVIKSMSKKNTVSLEGTSSVGYDLNKPGMLSTDSTGLKSLSIADGDYTEVTVSATFKIPASAISITGGSYSADVSKFIKAEKFSIKQNDGSYKIQGIREEKMDVEDTASLSLGNNRFDNLETLGIEEKITGNLKTNDITAQGVRVVTVVNEGLLKSSNIADYGYLVARLESDRTIGELDFNRLRVGVWNGEKRISCVNSSNGLSGDYGNYESDTRYKYVTLAVNGMESGDKIVARFYIKTSNGKYYYANYKTYGGILAEYKG